MALIDELKRQLADAEIVMEEMRAKRRKLNQEFNTTYSYAYDIKIAIKALEADVDDDEEYAPLKQLDTTIAALEPATATTAATATATAAAATTATAAAAATTAALEPTPAEQAPAQPDPLSAELRSVTPATEEESGDQIEDEPSEFISDLTGDPAVEPESGLHGEPEPTELDAPVSIVDDPELQAAVSRAEATLAAAEPNYVGLQDPELDAEYEAMKQREEAAKPKPRFSIFGLVKEPA